MTDLRQAAQQALEALEDLADCGTEAWSEQRPCVQIGREAITALRNALAQQAEPVYKDSTPHLHVGNSAFESWFQAQPFATQTGIKQISRDSYAAGMGDPLVVAAPQQQAEPVAYIHRQGNHYEVSERCLLDDEKARGWTEEPLYTAPPQRKLVPLTEEEIESCRQKGYAHAGLSAPFDFGKAARAVEQASWEKNHGQA